MIEREVQLCIFSSLFFEVLCLFSISRGRDGLFVSFQMSNCWLPLALCGSYSLGGSKVEESRLKLRAGYGLGYWISI